MADIISRATKQVITENDGIKGSSIEKSNLHDIEGKNVEKAFHHNEIAATIQQEIKLEPIVIEDETFKSDDEELPKVKTIPNKCYICDIILGSETEFNDHLKCHRNMLPHRCSQCSTESKPIEVRSVTALNKHFERHGYKYACSECPLQYRTRDTLTNHIRNTHEKRELKCCCKTCGKVYNSKKAYQRHVKAHRDLAMERYKCEPCQKVFSTKQFLEIHKKSYICARITEKKLRLETASNTSSVELGPCEMEENNVDKATGLIQEQMEQDSYDNEQPPNYSKSKKDQKRPSRVQKTIPNKCYICHTLLGSETAFNDHLESHNNMLPFKCSQCSTEESYVEAFSVTTLNKHFERHSFQFACQYCPLRFRRGTTLKAHMRKIHKKVHEQHCEICGQMFTSNQAYSRHMNIHKYLAIQLFKCVTCRMVFPSKRSLGEHRKSHLSACNMVNVAPLKIIDESKSELTIEIGERVTTSQKNNYEVFEQKETIESFGSTATGKLEHNLMNVANTINHDQIKQEPIDIKDELMESDEEKMHDDTSTHSFDSENNYLNHTKRQTKQETLPEVVKTIPNKCYICETTLQSKSEFTNHLENHRNMLPYECAQCSTETKPIIYTTMVLLNKHFEMHGFNYACPHCPLRYRTSGSFSHHVSTVHRQRCENTCKICGKSFTTESAFRKHAVAHQNVMTQRYKCECQKSFPTRVRLVRHQTHTSCPAARKSNQGNTTINLHSEEEGQKILQQNENSESNNPKSQTAPNKIVNKDNNDETVNQTSVGQSHVKNGNLSSQSEKQKRKKRIAQMMNTIPNKCYICDTILESKDAFNDHLESHRNMLIFECSQCSTDEYPVKILTLGTLNEHFERHGFKFACPRCPSRYRRHATLKYHVLNAHKGETIEYKCETCGQSFTDIKLYQNHANTHRKRIKRCKEYRCEKCQKIYLSERGLSNHRCMGGTEEKASLVSEFVQDRIEMEPVEIKDEPFNSDDVTMDEHNG